MDERTFDAVARTLASGRSRRQALRLLAAGALSAWLPRGAVAALARQECEAGLTYCPPRSDGQPEGCYDLLSDYLRCGSCDVSCPSASPGPMACIGGECVATGCAEGWTDCSGNLDCVDLSSDPFHCGGCGTVCDSGVCEAGACAQVGCAAGLTYCEEQPNWAAAGCYDLSADYLHCGSCMHQCPSAGPVEMACVGGECVVTDCGDLTDCTGNLDCTDLSSDPNNCGACGNVCASGICEAGSCFGGCGAGLAYCPARTIGIGAAEEPYELAAGCYDLFSDRDHCGSCDITCPTTVGCYGGECTLPPCEAGLSQCDGAGCVDLLNDPNHCGACDIVCSAGEVCEGGVCGPDTTCAAGLSYCPAKSEVGDFPAGCYDLSADANHCGSCDTSCATVGGPGNLICVAGECQPCSNGTRCGNTCYDLQSDPDHCGDCMTTCASGICEAGTCVDACETGRTRCNGSCVDLAADSDHCGACGVGCATGEVCEEGVCTATTPATRDATPSTTSAQEAVDEEDERPSRTRRDRTGQGTTPSSGATSSGTRATSSGTRATAPERRIQPAGSSAPESVLAWPFDADAGQWTIVHGYRAKDEDEDTATATATVSVATPAADRGEFARLALEFAVCPAEDVDAADGTCDLGAAGDDPSWDVEATRGSTIVSPVDGTVAWTDGEASCLAVGIDIADHAGYRLALFNVEGNLERGQRVTRGKRIGKVARRGCERGDRLRMALYQPQEGSNDDPVAAREGVSFNGEWAIDGCDYPDDRRTAEQYRGELVPCTPEDEVSASS